MNTPQKILKDYLKGISKVLDSNPPKEEVKEITRIKNMFSNSIDLIDHFSAKNIYYSNNKRINVIIKSLEDQLKFEKEKNKKLKKDIDSLIKTTLHQTDQTV